MSARKNAAQTNLRFPPALKTKLQAVAKKKGCTLTDEVVYRCTADERLKAALAAGEVPQVEPIPEAAPAPVSAFTAPQQAGELAAAPAGETWVLLKDIFDAVRQEDADCVIPSRLGKRLTELLRHYPRFSA